METVQTYENERLVALEVDPEEEGYLYCLDDEQKLVRMYDSGDGKL